tara:strand:+ start:267 stop:434 length:168 start_codon:yes stop_codon:yes gene_type:complete
MQILQLRGRYVDDNAPRNPTTPFSSSRDLGRVDTSHENLPVGSSSLRRLACRADA